MCGRCVCVCAFGFREMTLCVCVCVCVYVCESARVFGKLKHGRHFVCECARVWQSEGTQVFTHGSSSVEKFAVWVLKVRFVLAAVCLNLARANTLFCHTCDGYLPLLVWWT